jgi:hypothetical protein
MRFWVRSPLGIVASVKDIVALLTCFAMVYHFAVGDCYHAHCQASATMVVSATTHEHHDCGHHHHAHHHQACDDHGAGNSVPQTPSDPGCPHDDFHDGHSTATLIAGYQHWDTAKAPVAVLDGAIEIACERLGSPEFFCRDLAHDYHARARGDCYCGLGAFLS